MNSRFLRAYVVGVMLVAALPCLAAESWEEWKPQWGNAFSNFLDAIYVSDYTSVKQQLDAGMSVNWETETGLTPLSLAIAKGNDSIALLLLDRGARVHPDKLINSAIDAHSVRVLEWIDNKNKLVSYGSSAHLVQALEKGAPEKIFRLLLSKITVSKNDDRYFRSLLYNNKLSLQEKECYLTLLLKDGFLPVERGSIVATVDMARACGNEELIALTKPLMANVQVDQTDLNKSLLAQRTVAGLDSALDKGANPLGTTGGGCRQGSKDMTTPLEQLRGHGCNNGIARALNWQFLGRMLERDQKRIEPELTGRDKLFIAVTTGRVDVVKRLVNNKKGRFILDQSIGSDRRALTLAAEVGDSAMCSELCKVNFSREEYGYALQKAVHTGSPAVVHLLLGSMQNKKLETLKESEIVQLVWDMVYGYNRQQDNDTAIARHLFQYTQENGIRCKLPLESYVVSGVTQNQPLVKFLFDSQDGRLDSEVFCDHIGLNPQILLESSVMSRVTLQGYEKKVVSSLFGPLKNTDLGIPESLKKLKKVLFILNTLCAKDEGFGKSFEPGWIIDAGMFHVTYDNKKKRFTPEWVVPTPFSRYGNFDSINPSYGWRSDVITAGWEDENQQ